MLGNVFARKSECKKLCKVPRILAILSEQSSSPSRNESVPTAGVIQVENTQFYSSTSKFLALLISIVNLIQINIININIFKIYR